MIKIKWQRKGARHTNCSVEKICVRSVIIIIICCIWKILSEWKLQIKHKLFKNLKEVNLRTLMTVHWNKKIMTKELRKMSSFNIFSVALDKQIKSLHAVQVSQPQKSKCLNNWKPKSHHSYEADLSREYINALPSSIDQNWWSTYYILQPLTIWFHSNS